MRKNLSIICIVLSVMSLAQFKAENVFDNNQPQSSEHQQQQPTVDPNDPTQIQAAPSNTFTENEEQNSSLVPTGNGGEQPEGPGNPGEPVPINGLLPILLLSGLSLIIYYQRKNKKINI